jgi:hypothetical protein
MLVLSTVSPMDAWQTYDTIIGSAAATLTGLMFIAITLLAGSRARPSAQALGTFNTPTLFHFGAALFIAAVLAAPWPVLWYASVLLVLAGMAGLAYLSIVLWRMRRLTIYTPVPEDWLFHVTLPIVAYLVLVSAALLLPSNPRLALFGVGGVPLLLLFVGIHNAWDGVTFIVVQFMSSDDKPRDGHGGLPE